MSASTTNGYLTSKNHNQRTRISKYLLMLLMALLLVLGSDVTTLARCGQGAYDGLPKSGKCTGTPPCYIKGTCYGCKKKDCGEKVCYNPETGEYEVRSESDDENEPANDPVMFPSGRYVEWRTDLRTLQSDPTFTVARYYDSGHTFLRSPLGVEWDSTLMPRLQDNGETGVDIYLGAGAPYHVDKSGADYEASEAFQLTKLGSEFRMDFNNGAYLYFNDSNNAVSKVFTTGEYYQWIYDGSQNLLTVQDDAGVPIVAALWDASPNRITKVERLISDGVGGYTVEATTTYEYDGSGRLTRADGGCSSCSSADGAGGVYTYVASGDGAGKVEEVKDLNDIRQLKMVYDSSSRVITQFRNTANEFATYDYSGYATGVYSYTDFESVERKVYQDNEGRITKNETLDNGTTVELFEKLYGANGNITMQRTAMSISGGTTKWREERFEWDGSDNMTLAYNYSSAGNITTARYVYDGNGDQITGVDVNNVTRIAVYDGNHNRLTLTEQYPSGNITTWWMYNADHNMTKYSDEAGILYTYDYDGNGYLLTTTKDVGDASHLNIITAINLPDANGNVTKRVDARNQEWLTYFDVNSKVTRMVYPSGLTTTYDYDTNGRQITQQRYESGGSVTLKTINIYDNLGRRITTTNPAGNHTIFAYDDNDKLTYTKDVHGVETGTDYHATGKPEYQLAYDGSSWITKTTFFYDLDNHVTKQTDANDNALVKNREYDDHGRLTRQTDALDNYIVFSYNGAGRVTQQIGYDSGNTAQSESRTAYNSAGRSTSRRSLATPGSSTSNSDRLVEMDYDNSGRVITSTSYLSGAATTAKTFFTYDNVSRQITQTQDDGPTVAFLYDDTDLTKKITDPATLALATSYAFDELGRTTRTTNPDSTYSVTIYDGLGRVTKTIRYDSGNIAFAATVPLYHDTLGAVTKRYQISDPSNRLTFIAATDPANESVYTAAGRLTKTIDPNSNATTYDYDTLGRQITTTDPASNKSIVHYDDANRVTRRERIDEDAAGDKIFITAYDYDALNRQITRTQQGPDADITATTDNLITIIWYDASGQVTQTQDPAGTTSAQAYDKLGRLTRQTEDAAGIARYTDYLHDRAGRRTRQTGYTADASGAQNTDSLYNKAGVLTKTTYPDSSTVSFVLDSANRVTRQTDPRNISLDFAYDSMGRLLTKNESTNIYWTFTYDNAGRRSLSMKGTTAGGIQIARSNLLYDGLGRLTYDGQIIRGLSGRQVRYVYDKAGNITAQYYPSGSLTISRTLTSRNQTDLIKRNGTQLADYDYVGGRVDDLTYETGANDVQADRIYDGAGRMTRLTWAQTANTLPDFSYYFDSTGNITRKTHEHRASNNIEDYTMDGLDRLTNARYDMRTLTHGFTYDDLGNRLTFDENANQTTGYFNGVNELTRLNATQVYSDAAGNLTKDAVSGNGPYSYYYDAENKLTKVTKSGGDVATYEYDALGRRIEFIDSVNTVTKLYYHEGKRDRVIEEYNGAGTPARQRYFVWGNYVDELLMYYEDGDTADYFVTYNHLFSPVALVGNTGTIQETYEYDAYGKPVIYTTTLVGGDDGDWWDGDEDTSSSSAKGLSYLFTGREFDSLDSGDLPLQYSRARSYSPELMRFLQRDPGGYVDGMSLYEYVRSQAHKLFDPSGGGALAVSYDSKIWPEMSGMTWPTIKDLDFLGHKCGFLGIGGKKKFKHSQLTLHFKVRYADPSRPDQLPMKQSKTVKEHEYHHVNDAIARFKSLSATFSDLAGKGCMCGDAFNCYSEFARLYTAYIKDVYHLDGLRWDCKDYPDHTLLWKQTRDGKCAAAKRQQTSVNAQLSLLKTKLTDCQKLEK